MIKNRIAYNPVINWRFDLDKAKDSYLWDKKGNKYIDFSSGWNTTNLGWNNKEIRAAAIEQLGKNVYAPMWSADDVQIEYAQALTAAFPKELDCVCRATGGTEANEMALKIARAATGRSQIVSFAHTYHGQSFGTLALGFLPEYVKAIAPLVPDFIQLEYPDAFSEHGESEKEILNKFLVVLEETLKTKNVAAILTEAGMITGWGSMLVAPKGFLKSVQDVARKYGTLLVVDEVGTGFSRTGKLFAIEHESVVPDIVTLAKGISNGASAIGAVVCKSKLIERHLASFKPTSTFGWTPLACAIALKNLQIHQRDEVWIEAERKGKLVKKMLNSKFRDDTIIKNLRGMGLELAFDTIDNDFVLEKCFENGLHLADAGNCVQLMPPLTISDEDLINGMNILIDVIEELKL